MRALPLGVLVIVALLAPGVARAATPCCGVTAIDARAGVVTARDTATGRTFQFTLDDLSLAASVKVGQAVDADFKTMKATVRPSALEPCCNVTAVSARAATVRNNATGRTSELAVRDARLLGMLKVGQTVVADVATGVVAIAPTGVIGK